MADDSLRPYTPEELAALEALGDKATPAPWEQLSGKYMAIDRGEHPQVFRDLTAVDEQFILAVRNAFPRLIHQLRQQTACAEAAERERDRVIDNEFTMGDEQRFFIRMRDDLEACEKERDAARTALAECTKERDDADAQLQSCLAHIDRLMADQLCTHGVVQLTCPDCITPEQERYDAALKARVRTWMQQHRDALETQLDAARTALATAEEARTEGDREYARAMAQRNADVAKQRDHIGHLLDKLAAAEAERARLAGAVEQMRVALYELERETHHEDGMTFRRLHAMALRGLDEALENLTASPHADLAAVRAVANDAADALKWLEENAVIAMLCNNFLCDFSGCVLRRRLTDDLAALPNWCRE